MSSRVQQLIKVQIEAKELFERKNNDYGDAFATYGPTGVLVRIGDKLSRFTSITNSGVQLVDTEGLRDTLIDLHNYAAMAVMLLDDTQVNSINCEARKIHELRCAGVTIKELTDLNYTPTAMRQSGIGASQLRAHGFGIMCLKDAGYSMFELKDAGYTLFELSSVGCTPSELRSMGISNNAMHSCGYSVYEIYDLMPYSSNMSYEANREKVREDVYTKKLGELRRFDDDKMSSIEGGNRPSLCDDIAIATRYADEAISLFEKQEFIVPGYHTTPDNIVPNTMEHEREENKMMY